MQHFRLEQAEMEWNSSEQRTVQRQNSDADLHNLFKRQQGVELKHIIQQTLVNVA